MSKRKRSQPQAPRRAAWKEARRRAAKAGLPPGTAVYVGEARSWKPVARRFDYGPESFSETEIDAAGVSRPDPGTGVHWFDVTGIHDVSVVTAFGTAFGLHPLVVEDILNPSARPKVEAQAGLVFVAARELSLALGEPCPSQRIESDQVALLVGPDWLISFQQRPGDPFEPTRDRIRKDGSRARLLGSDFLLHALVDALADGYLQAIDRLLEAVDALDRRALEEPETFVPADGHVLRDDIAEVRRAAAPLHDAIVQLLREGRAGLSEEVRPYFGDVLDHLKSAVDLADGARDRLISAFELHLAASNLRLAEAMRMLSVIASIFIPLTFVAGVYGMNFKHMPELGWQWGYPAVLLVMAGIAWWLVAYFRRRRWL